MVRMDHLRRGWRIATTALKIVAKLPQISDRAARFGLATAVDSAAAKRSVPDPTDMLARVTNG